MQDNAWPIADPRPWRAQLRAATLYSRQMIAGLTRQIGANAVSWLVGVVFGAVILAGLAIAVRRDGWLSTVADLSVNIAASVAVGAAAVAAFVIASRRQALSRLLAAQRGRMPETGTRSADRIRQAQAVVAQLTDGKQSGSILIEAPKGSGRTSFLRELVDALADVGVVAVELNEWDLAGASVIQAATDAFRRLMAQAGVDAPLVRTMEYLARRRQVVVLIDGLDSFTHTARRSSAIETTRRRIEELGAGHLAHVAVVDNNSTPPELVRSRVRLAQVGRIALMTLVTGSSAPPSDALNALSRQLGSTMAHLRLSLHTLRAVAAELRSTQDDEALLHSLHTQLNVEGPTAFLLRRLDGASSAALASLDRIVEYLLLYDSTQVMWSDLVARLEWNAIDEFVLGANELEQKAIVERQEHFGELMIRFLDPEIRELAVGIRLAQSRAPFKHSVVRGTGAFTGELIRRTVEAADHETCEQVWRDGCEIAAHAGFLSSVGDADRALRVLGISPPSLSAEQLSAFWEAADDADRTLFVKRLPQVISADAISYLWSRLRAPLINQTTHGLRRDIASALCDRGDATWDCLGAVWESEVRIAEGGGLAWRDRPSPVWRKHGGAVASLGWILPPMALTTTGSAAQETAKLLERFVAATVPGGGLADDHRADPGIEISLAEGCKDAAAYAFSSGHQLSNLVWDIASLIATTGGSWVSRMLALQANALGTAADPAQLNAFLPLADRLTCDAHPITSSYARHLEAVAGSKAAQLAENIYTVVWPDDTDTLAAAGDELDDESARALAATTIILNLVEGRLRVVEPGQKSAHRRAGALTLDVLPGCLISPVLAYGSDIGRCGCEFGLCGPEPTLRALRHVSQPFAHRCLVSTTRKRSVYDLALNVQLRRLTRS